MVFAFFCCSKTVVISKFPRFSVERAVVSAANFSDAFRSSHQQIDWRADATTEQDHQNPNDLLRVLRRFVHNAIHQRPNPKACEKIAENAKQFYDTYLSKEGIFNCLVSIFFFVIFEDASPVYWQCLTLQYAGLTVLP